MTFAANHDIHPDKGGNIMRGVYKKKNAWFIHYYYNGKRFRKSVGPSKKVAENALRKIKVAIAEERFLDKKSIKKVKFEDFAEQYLRIHCHTNHKEGSRKKDLNSVNILKQYFSGKYLQDITTLEIDKFKTKKIEEVKPATVNRRLAFLKSMFNKAIEWGMATENPAKKVKLLKENNKRFRYLEKEEITKLLDNSEGYVKNVILVAINTGMRRGEILKLKWHDVDFNRGTIHIHDTKSKESRAIPMNETVKRTLMRIEKTPESPYIFNKPGGKARCDIRKSFLQAQRKSGILNFRLHDLRHTFASQLVMAGVDLNTVRELLGHKNIQMTLRYSHLSSDHKKRAVDALSRQIDTCTTPKPELTVYDKFDISHNSLKKKELV